jgi:small-conductance mechanosensitive channel
LRTFDNRFVRIPNESLIKGTFINITRFPIRRMDIDIRVAYKEDVDHVVRVLTEIADQNPYALDEPAPLILFNGFGDSALEFLLGVWFEKTDTLTLRNSIMKEIKSRFDREGIEIPFPHRTLCVGANSAPFPVRMVDAT